MGGAVRDKLLGKAVTERDYVVVGATAEAMLALGYQQVGKDFPVFLHPQTKEEYALARTERKTGRGYGGFSVFADPGVTLEDDLQRRDLTVNAIAESATGELIDPYGGLADLKQKVLRHVSPAFAEDPLRVIRAARFAARFAIDGFRIAPETLQLMQQLAADDELKYLSAERIWRELERSLMTPTPAVFFTVLADAHALTPWFAEFQDEPDFELLINQLAEAQPLHEAEQRFALLCASLSKSAIATLTKRLKIPNHVRHLTIAVASWFQWLPAQLTPQLTPQLTKADAEALAKRFKEAGIQRKPELLASILAVLECLGVALGVRQQISSAASAQQQVSAAPFMAQGLAGAELGEALQAAQLDAIRQTLSLSQHKDE